VNEADAQLGWAKMMPQSSRGRSAWKGCLFRVIAGTDGLPLDACLARSRSDDPWSSRRAPC
jgi:hypothetical protein